MRYDKKKIENIFTVCIVSVFLGQIQFNPFDSTVTFSLSVVSLSLMLIFLKNLPIVFVSNIVGLSVFVFRCFIALINNPEVTLLMAVRQYYSALVFYLVFGLLFKIIDIRGKIDIPFRSFVYILLTEVVANIIEVSVTRNMIYTSYENAIKIIIVIGIIRTTLTISLYRLIRYYFQRYEKEQRENKFREMVFFVASLKTELFFLKKSSGDIEHAMNKSFNVYQKVKESEIKEDALAVTKDIHEIKKDYMRVLTGIENTLVNEKVFDYMTIDHVFRIIKGNAAKVIHDREKNIELDFEYDNNFKTMEFYPIISILNNLIINAIDSIEKNGKIGIKCRMNEANCFFIVSDDGCGIEEEDLDMIFEPGYSTKLDTNTGEFSTGIGLTHVKNIIEEYFEGKLIVESKENRGTEFTIDLPVEKVILYEGGVD